MRLYMEEDDGRWPKLAIRTVQTAVARHVLHGGLRYTAFNDEQEPGGYLTFHELSLLADMDERSVRNAANPKLQEPLVTKNFGRRTLIAIDDARRWLAGRKGFVPTQGAPAEPQIAAPQLSTLTVPYEIVARVSESANAANMSTADFLANLLDKHQGDAQ